MFIFSFILLPITFAYPIRNYILFGQKPFAVQSASELLYIGNYPLWEQFVPIDKTLFQSSFLITDHNVFSNALRTSINPFWFLNNFIVVIEYITSIALLLISVCGIISLSSTKKENLHIKFAILVTSLWSLSFIILNLTMPYSCSAHARYIVTPIIFFAIQLGFIFEYCKRQKIKDSILILLLTYSIIAITIVAIYTFLPTKFYFY